MTEQNVPNQHLQQIASTLEELPFPSRFAVELCADCNLDCAMCHHARMVRPKGVMPLPLWQKCADEIAQVQPTTQCWFSFCGEPLMEPELLFECIRYGKKVGLQSLNINTNGQLLTPELDEGLLTCGADLVVFGIDGFSKPVFESLRRGADRDVVYGNVERLLAKKAKMDGPTPVIQVQFIEMETNRHEFEEYREFWHARGATVKQRRQLSWGGKFGTELVVPDEHRIPCPWAITMMHVFWDGRVPRCPGDTEGDEGFGNVWQQSVTSAWKGLSHYREMHLEHRFGDLPTRCHTCQDWMTGAAARIKPDSEQADSSKLPVVSA